MATAAFSAAGEPPPWQQQNRSVMTVQARAMVDTLEKVHNEQIVTTAKIQKERLRIEDLEFRVRRAQEEMERRRKLAATAKRVDRGQRIVQRLENQLQLTAIRASTIWAANEHLKTEVNEIRREKVMQRRAQQRLATELARQKHHCSGLIRAVQALNENKERVRREVALVEAELQQEKNAFQDEFAAIMEQTGSMGLDVEASHAKLEDMTRLKGGGSFLQAGGSIDSARGANDMSPMSPVRAQEKRLKQQCNMAYWVCLKKRNDLQIKAERAAELQSMLDKIGDAAGPATLEDFVPIMLEAEEENYSLFKLITELNKELEELEHEKSAIAAEAEGISASTVSGGQQQRKADMQEQIERAKARVQEHDLSYRRDLDVLRAVEETLTSVFNKVGVTDEAVTKQLSSVGLTERNVLPFLGLIEEQIEHIVQIYNNATDGAPLTNARRPATPQIDSSTGRRVPSLQPPAPPSTEAIEIMQQQGEHPSSGTSGDQGQIKPLDTAALALEMKEAVARLPSSPSPTRRRSIMKVRRTGVGNKLVPPGAFLGSTTAR
jgi:hypothetical protein